MARWTGGCLCGAVRYELSSDPVDAGWCHCRKCQLNSGAPAMVFATVPIGDFHLTKGESEVREIRTSSFGRRSFCSGCGTPFLMQVDHQPETVDLTVATLDTPNKAAPGFHIFWGSRVSWFDPNDQLPRHEKFRPGTRGLDGTEPSGN